MKYRVQGHLPYNADCYQEPVVSRQVFKLSSVFDIFRRFVIAGINDVRVYEYNAELDEWKEYNA